MNLEMMTDKEILEMLDAEILKNTKTYVKWEIVNLFFGIMGVAGCLFSIIYFGRLPFTWWLGLGSFGLGCALGNLISTNIVRVIAIKDKIGEINKAKAKLALNV